MRGAPRTHLCGPLDWIFGAGALPAWAYGNGNAPGAVEPVAAGFGVRFVEAMLDMLVGMWRLVGLSLNRVKRSS
jgi:hypothetical protein